MAHVDPDEMPNDDQREIMCVLMDSLLCVGASWALVRYELKRIAKQPLSPIDYVPSQRTLERMLLDYFQCTSLTELRQKRKDSVAETLKGKAVAMALAGNVPMLIFSLKNLAGWSDNVKVSGDKDKRTFTLAYRPEDLVDGTAGTDSSGD